MTSDQAHLAVLPARGAGKAVVLVLHGGQEFGTDRVSGWARPYLRMIPLAWAIHRVGRPHGIEVCRLRNRVRGWNAPKLDAVRDGRWALEQIKDRHPDLPIVLVGHSMGGRVALRIADDPSVIGVCALAPWTTEKDWVSPVEGVKVLIAHGTSDVVTRAESSYEFAKRAFEVGTLARVELRGEGHSMVRRPATWHRLVRAFVLDAFGFGPCDPLLADVWDLPPSERLAIAM
ncbi:MAG: alpha/beta hydrolase [Haloechinothrix sp.]